MHNKHFGVTYRKSLGKNRARNYFDVFSDLGKYDIIVNQTTIQSINTEYIKDGCKSKIMFLSY